MNREQKQKKNLLVGLSIFTFFGIIIYYIIFINNKKEQFQELNTNQYNYILISSLSAIFKTFR